MDTLLTTVTPLLTDALSVAILGLLAMLQLGIRRSLGLEAEKIWREALHSAVTTGASTVEAKAGEANDLETAAAQVVSYAKRSVPGAIAGLKAADDVLFDLARSKLRQMIAKGS
ncbi:hypothetical protein C5F48_18560 [Cereibacter changlensis JA139]|uniref:Uncharacterized protein n=2 Tax=Cereibacter changlensis TaxID=402884 RepID=A0A2T4JQP9_9RHOB|nr:hypothetical protein [Cereibacter changlensis]PTE20240.1 hypothetical protein C5F48_18560 [Cereibacter changlensis JA139]PZX47760.1 hypothetical protein LX76_04408 [Cereibacter changlensis]